jgi:hypothetical protein
MDMQEASIIMLVIQLGMYYFVWTIKLWCSDSVDYKGFKNKTECLINLIPFYMCVVLVIKFLKILINKFKNLEGK